MPIAFRGSRLLAEVARLRRYARILAGDSARADRLVQETLLRAGSLQGEDLSESARRFQLFQALRSMFLAREGEWNDPGSRPPGDETETAMPPLDGAAALIARLRELPLEQREVLVLVAVERMAYDEIAVLLQMPVATVISRLSQARESLSASMSIAHAAPRNAN